MNAWDEDWIALSAADRSTMIGASMVRKCGQSYEQRKTDSPNSSGHLISPFAEGPSGLLLVLTRSVEPPSPFFKGL